MSSDIKERSAEHLVNLRAVYQKKPALIDEFVKVMNFDCNDIHRNEDCDGCSFANKPEDSIINHCCMFCNEGKQKLNDLISLLKAGDA